jgi:NADH-quinone oxidoreductase subunit M
MIELLFRYWPAIGAGIVAAVVPRRDSAKERAGLGLITFALILAVQALWPSDVPLNDAQVAAAAAGEWPSLLNLLIGLPIAGAVAVLFLPRQLLGLVRGFTLLVMGVVFALSLVLLSVPMTEGWHFQFIKDWMPAWGIRWHVAIDGISLWLVLLTTFITPIATYAAFGSIKTRIKELCFAILLLQGAMIGAFVALDLFVFYVFWELVLVPMYVMIGIWGGADKIKAAIKFFLYTMAGSMLMLAAMIYLVTRTRSSRAPGPSTTSPSRASCSRAARSCSASGPSPSPSSSRCRCGRCTPGCPTPTCRRRRAAPSSSRPSC